MKRIYLFLVFLLLIVGCSNQENNSEEETYETDLMKVSIFTEKDVYEREEPFSLRLDVDYKGEPMEAAIIFDLSRKGFSKHFYVGYLEELNSEGLDRSDLHAGSTSGRAYRIYEEARSR